jgi:putative ABC transport system ATP-binding protein
MALNDYRRRMVGFVWQQKARNLIPYLQVEQNIELPMIMAGVGQRERRDWVKELIAAVGLTTRRGHKLAQLSGGEQQRVAIAVALSNHPALLLADEPTGELDSSSAAAIFELFHSLNRAFGLTVVIVSHDANVARYVERVVAIRDGKTSSETMRKPRDQGNGTADSAAEGQDGQAAHVFEELMMLDSAGRLQVPKEVRERYGIGDRVHMEETADGLLLRPVAGAEAPVRRLAPADEPPPRKVGRLGRMVNRVRGRG